MSGELQWITQFGQLTASGALIGLLGWALYYLPRYLEGERISREKVASSHSSALTTMVEKFEEMSKYERESCESRHKDLVEMLERRHTEIAQSIAQTHEIVRETRHVVGSMAQTEANRRATEDLQRGSRRQPKAQGGGEA
jgi:pyruvate formate-lyase activating enzyme-like uncharacterized protein